MQVAVLGLSKNGKLITEKLLAGGHEVVVWNAAPDALDALRTEKAEFVVSQKLILVHTIEELRNFLRKPRVIWSSQASGEPTETTLSKLNNLVEAGDVVIDGGDTNYKDTQRHAEEFEIKGVKFLGVGVTGGIHGLENGCSLMVGGSEDAYQFIEPVLDSIANPNGAHVFFGMGGAGHFVKMVHDAIASGMTQAIAEGMGLLKSSGYQLDLEGSVFSWQEGGVISSFLLDMVMDTLEKDPNLSQFDGNIAPDTSAKWAIEEAKSKNLPAAAINQSIDFRDRSSYDRVVQETFAAKVIQGIKKEVEG